MRFLMAVLAGVAGVMAAAPGPQITVRARNVPVEGVAAAPSLATGSEGTVWLSWIETTPAGPADGLTSPAHGHGKPAPAARLRLARLDDDCAVRAVAPLPAEGSQAPSLAEVPPLAVGGDGRVHVVWLDGEMKAQRAVFDPLAPAKTAPDAGSWSQPEPFTRAPGDRERFALARLEDGRVLAAWLDGRDYARTREQTLRARIVDAPDDAEQVVAPRVCECCETSLTPLRDGGALLAFRGRDDQEVRDIHVARWRDGAWSKPQVVNPDGWRIKGCPVNGPRVHGDGSRAALAWFTAANGAARVLASVTPDAAGQWLMPLRVDEGEPAGHVDTVRLQDGAVLVTWLRTDGSLWLRRLKPEHAAGAVVRLTPAGGVAPRTAPRIVLRQDYAGGDTEAVVLVAHQRPAGGLGLLEVRVPEGALRRQELDCGCAPAADELRGYPVRGRVLDGAAAGRIRIVHTEVPGVLPAGRRECAIDPADRLALAGHAEFLGRIEADGGGWKLFAVKALAAPLR